MNDKLKQALKNAAVGGMAGATLGAACGAAAGNVGLTQVCAAYKDDYSCQLIKDTYGNKAAGAGAGVGAAVGFAAGAILYPPYKAFVGWYYNRDNNQRTNTAANPGIEMTNVERGPKI